MGYNKGKLLTTPEKGERHPVATYKWHRAGQRIRDRLGTPQGGPLVPPSQRFPGRGGNQGVSSRAGTPPPPGHRPVLDMKPDGTLAPMGWRQGTSLPGYRAPRPRTGLLGEGKIPPAVLDGLGLAVDLMPAGRAIRGVKGAFELLQGLDYWNDWAYQRPDDPGTHGLPDVWSLGFGETQACGAPPKPGAPCYEVIAQTTDYYSEWLCTVLPIPMQAINSGATRFDISGVPVSGNFVIPAGTRQITFGEAQLYVGGECIRQNMTLQVGRTVPLPVDTPWPAPRPALSPLAWPLPVSVPPAPALVEETAGRAVDPSPAKPKPWLRLRPYEQPAVEVGQTGGRPPTKPTPVAHARLPPGPKLKEGKRAMGARAAAGVLGRLYDAATEGLELVDIFYDAMEVKPPFRPGKPYNPAEKAAWVYDNFEHLNIEKLLLGLGYNKLEDATLGRFMAMVGKNTPFGSQGPVHGGWLANIPL